MNTTFYQSGPQLHPPYESDRLLQEFLRAQLGDALYAEISAELALFSTRIVSQLDAWSKQAEAEEPVLVSHDPWGHRRDEIKMSAAWHQLTAAAAEEGIVATAYERKFGEYSRLLQFAKLYLFHPSSAFVSCPLAMTDGAARALELYGDENQKKSFFAHLVSRDPKKFWTSGQWMTERTGGSDVSGTETIAKPLGKGKYALYGDKWFTSATTSQMAMALARIEGHPEGSKGLSLFCLKIHDEQGHLQNIQVNRLKDKLGTRAMPTAELSLNGAVAELVGGEGNGVKKIASLFNVTRMYNAVCALGAARRAIMLAQDYSGRRVAFGKALNSHALHIETLADLQVEYAGNFFLTFELAHLLGRDEMKLASAEESALLRMLTPIAKLYTGKSCMAITSEVTEIFGGAGYIEDVGISKLHRDAQVFSIWEGTTNVLSLDVLRAIEKENALVPFLAGIQKRLELVTAPALMEEVKLVSRAHSEIAKYFSTAFQAGPDFILAGARQLSFSLARTFAASLLLSHAQRNASEVNVQLAKRWCAKGLTNLLQGDSKHREFSKQIVL